MGKVVVKSSPLDGLRETAGPYAPQVRAFVIFVEQQRKTGFLPILRY